MGQEGWCVRDAVTDRPTPSSHHLLSSHHLFPFDVQVAFDPTLKKKKKKKVVLADDEEEGVEAATGEMGDLAGESSCTQITQL